MSDTGDGPDDRTLIACVTAVGAGDRLDTWLAAVVPNTSRSRFKALVRQRRIHVDGVVVDVPNTRLKRGQEIRCYWPAPVDPVPKPQAIALDVVYEDAHLIVVNKPAGLVVHPAAGNWSGTLVNALLHHCGDSLSGIGGVRRPGIVHRLDKNTSGLLVAAKTDDAHSGLARQFADHGRTGPLQRRYRAIVWGCPAADRGTIDAPIARAPNSRTKMAIARTGGRHARTHYTLVARYHWGDRPVASLIACRLETGRTHQIRVHLAHLGHPVVGDPDYAAGFKTMANVLPEASAARIASFTRQALHAGCLGFRHPVSGADLRFSAPCPADMAALLEVFQRLR